MARDKKFSDHEMARRRDALRGFMGKPHPMVVAYQDILQEWKKNPLQLTKNDFLRVTNVVRAGDYEMLKNLLTETKNRLKRLAS